MTATVLSLEGAPNFRDMGGYATTDGHVVKRGLLFRSGESSNLSDADIDKLKKLDARMVVDLRSAKEVASAKILWPLGSACEFIAADIRADLRADNQPLTELLFSDPTVRGASNMMEWTYQVLPNSLGPTLLKIVQGIVDKDQLPVILHCAIGRDRAGITAAMLLFALGVPRETVIADYLRTNVCINTGWVRDTASRYLMEHKIALSEETLDILTFARIEHFHSAFRTVAVEHGTVDNYLRTIGIDDNLKAALRQRLLEPA